MKSRLTRKRVDLDAPFFMNYVRKNLLKIRSSLDLFGTERCEVTFGL